MCVAGPVFFRRCMCPKRYVPVKLCVPYVPGALLLLERYVSKCLRYRSSVFPKLFSCSRSSLYPKRCVPEALFSRSSMFPNLSVPQEFCVPEALPPELNVPGALCSPGVLCSRSSLFSELYVLGALYVSEVLCSLNSMFLKLCHVSGVQCSQNSVYLKPVSYTHLTLPTSSYV